MHTSGNPNLPYVLSALGLLVMRYARPLIVVELSVLVLAAWEHRIFLQAVSENATRACSYRGPWCRQATHLAVFGIC